MKLKSSHQETSLFRTICIGILASIVVIVSCKKGINTSDTELSIATPIPLNLLDEKQQADFQNYLKNTVDLLNDSSYIYLFRSYNLKNLSSIDKEQIAKNLVKDQNFMSKLNAYQSILRDIEKSYHFSTFTKEQRNEVIKFGMRQGIYFFPGLKEKVKTMEEKSLANMQKNHRSTVVYCCTCSDRVEAANSELASSIQVLTLGCLRLSEYPPAAAICWIILGSYYLEENNRINSTEYWCECMIENYGICMY